MRHSQLLRQRWWTSTLHHKLRLYKPYFRWRRFGRLQPRSRDLRHGHSPGNWKDHRTTPLGPGRAIAMWAWRRRSQLRRRAPQLALDVVLATLGAVPGRDSATPRPKHSDSPESVLHGTSAGAPRAH